MSKITIRELAKSLGISISSVSKALKDSHEISPATKQRVLAMASKLNYIPNPYASSLRKKKSKTVGVIVPEVADSFFSVAINGIQSVAGQKGYHLLIYLSHDKFENEKLIVDDFSSGRVDGVLISISGETTTSTHLQQLANEQVPIVFFDREFQDFETARVVTNDVECGYMAARHLLDKGVRRPVFLSVYSSIAMCQKRAAGFMQCLSEAGLQENRWYKPVIYCKGSNDEIYHTIEKLLKQKHAPDGIVASVERLGIQVYRASQALHLNIPQQLKVIAFSTLETAAILNPSLTTICQPAFDMGKTAAELLFKRIEKSQVQHSAERVVLPSTLVERVSTGG